MILILNSMAEALGRFVRRFLRTVVNYLLFVFILLIGHVLNLALSCLGAFVHPLRLTFVEYFKNSGYEGSGRTFRPLKK